MVGVPVVREITEAEYWRWRVEMAARIRALLDAEPDEVACEHCRDNADEIRSVGMDHRNYAPGLCDDCGTEWPHP